MAENSTIEWTDSTFNPWIGCTKVGPGCDHCYAETRDRRKLLGPVSHWGPGAPRHRTSAATWANPRKWQKEAAAFFAAHRRRRRVFCASMADVFDNEVDPAWRADLFALIRACPDLDWLLLTKRIGNVSAMAEAAGGLPEPVRLGATMVNQAEVDRDWTKLAASPAREVLVSIEPMLGPITLPSAFLRLRRPWIIVGGEAYAGARPMHPDWARSLRDQCAAAGVPFLFKQWGDWAPHTPRAGGDLGGDVRRGHVTLAHPSGDDDDTIIERSGCRLSEPGSRYMARVGKKAAGRLLDGHTHDGFPASPARPTC